MTSIAETAYLILSKHPLCDTCLGRQFARISTGFTNRERGHALKLVLLMEAIAMGDGERLATLAVNGGMEAAAAELQKLGVERPHPMPCSVCGGRLSEEIFRMVAERIVGDMAGYEYRTFLVGAWVPAKVRDLEDSIRSTFSISTAEDFKNDVTREIGKLIASATGAAVDHISPDLTIIVDIFAGDYTIIANPVFIGGRYLKHSRSIPQSIWHCRRCWGKGCSQCGYTGREYPTSVSEIIGIPVAELFQAHDFKFHAAGREDVDALVEGGGRPFVLELKRPRKRFLDLAKAEELVNMRSGGLVTVRGLRYTTRKEMRELKLTSHMTVKTYAVSAEFEKELDLARLAEVESILRDVIVEQWTPLRVLKRRGDKLRRKMVYEVKATPTGPKTVIFTIRCQGGLYVKELITGDAGRTKPNIADILLNNPVKIELTVTNVETLQ
jgi:tRNA pseudouridine synthase 10